MKLSMTGQMRMEQRMKLAPRMIQSMEILQLPALALLEKIEAELNQNPVLEIEEPHDSAESEPQTVETETSVDEKDLVIGEDNNKLEDFQRLDDFTAAEDDYIYRNEMAKASRYKDEPDKKLEALNNTAESGKSLHEHLINQWRLVDADELVKKAGEVIIDYIDKKGFLKVRLEQLCNKDKTKFNLDHLESALAMVQQLDPAGVGARDIRECLLIQMAQDHEDVGFESQLISEHMDMLLENKLPEIAKKMNCSTERVYQAIERLRKLDTSPGLQVSKEINQPIRPDIIVEATDEGKYIAYLAEADLPSLRVNQFYAGLARDKKVDTKARQFLKSNIRSAQWFMEAIEQRKNTLVRVAQAVTERQGEFFDNGPMFLKPLPMSEIADAVGVHVATVSRAVSGKYIQSPQGIMPLRDLFGGGMENDDGQNESFEAIRAKMQQVINEEDKAKPLSDDAIKKKLEEMGISTIARRTVAKYRKIMNIPAARFRKKY